MNSEYVIDQIEQGDLIATLIYDECPANPRKEFDNFGTIFTKSREYDLDNRYLSEVADERDDGSYDLRNLNKDYVWLPIYVREYSNWDIHVSTGGAADDLESYACEGVIAVSKADILSEFGGKIVTKALRKRALEILESEITELHQYWRGEVYMWYIEDPERGVLDSCGGYYDEDYAMSEMKASLNWHVVESELQAEEKALSAMAMS